MSQYGSQHALGISLHTIEALSKVKGVIVAEDSGMEMPAFSSHSTPRRVLKRCMKNTSTRTELCATRNIHYSDMIHEILRFTRQTAADYRRLPADPTQLGLLPVEGFAQLEIPVADVQELTGSRSTGPAVLEQTHSISVAPETIGYWSRLLGTRTMEIYEDGWWLGC